MLFFSMKCKQLQRQLETVNLSQEVLVFGENDARHSRNMLSNFEQLIFVGGVPRSGTTLMRAILDAHPDVRCGGETMLLPSFLTWQAGWRTDWVNNSGITQEVFDDAVSAFITEIIAKHGELAPRLCNKDPYTALWLPTIQRLYPNSKFILMIRDARAVIHSMIERKVPVAGYNTSDEQSMFVKWNQEIRKMLFQCNNAPGQCIKVYYERLIQKPEEEIQRITNFLDLQYSQQMLHHHELIGAEVDLNDQEFSASQVKNSINTKALTSWFDCFSEDTLRKLDDVAPFLSVLGYDTSSSKPDYSMFADDDFYQFRNFYS
ncbi:hypothetical protein L3Y34_000052 [Caenorhabditis briggsae]|nr:hypothetical protein L3Y34_000052 [Caenorhabditis briggsae]